MRARGAGAGDKDVEVESHPSRQPLAAMMLQRIAVLIIDDSELILQRLARMLVEQDGVGAVLKAATGREGVEMTHKFDPELVILDIRMPGGSGLDVLPEIKSHDPSPTVAVLTNYPSADYQKRCTELGADFFFEKATEFTKLLEVCSRLITEKRASCCPTPSLDDDGGGSNEQ